MIGKICNEIVGKTFMTEEGLMTVIHVFFNEEWNEYCIQARPPRANKIGDEIFTFIPEDLWKPLEVERVFETNRWHNAKAAHRIFELEIVAGKTVVDALRVTEHQVPQRMG